MNIGRHPRALLGPSYFQLMLGGAQPDTRGYADDRLYRHRDAHLEPGENA